MREREEILLLQMVKSTTWCSIVYCSVGLLTPNCYLDAFGSIGFPFLKIESKYFVANQFLDV